MILVTGATGYIGSHMVYRLMECGYKVLMLDNLSNSRIDVAHVLIDEANAKGWPTPVFIEADLMNRDLMFTLFERFDIDTVFHFAGWKSVSESMRFPLQYVSNNVTGLNNLLLNTQGTVKKFIFSSSCAVYAPTNSYEALSETSNLGPVSPYGMTKLMCEQILERLGNLDKDFRYVNLRYFNPIGAHPNGLIGERPIKSGNLMPMLGSAALGLISNVTIYGNDYRTDDQTAIRDYVDIMDLVAGHLAAYLYLEKGGVSDTFNLGRGLGVSVMEMFSAYRGVSDTNPPIEWKTRRHGDPQSLIANVKKAKTILDWEPKMSLYDSILSDWKWRKASL
jgi:UDP-glucose 4-epimerase